MRGDSIPFPRNTHPVANGKFKKSKLALEDTLLIRCTFLCIVLIYRRSYSGPERLSRTISREKNMSDKKSVIIIDEKLPLGVIANTSAVIAASFGKFYPEMIGENLTDYQGHVHEGITTVALPILKGSAEQLKAMREQLREFEPELLVVDIISATRTTRSYEEYAAVLAQGPDDAIQYQGLGLIGDKKLVTKLTGNLGLLR